MNTFNGAGIVFSAIQCLSMFGILTIQIYEDSCRYSKILFTF